MEGDAPPVEQLSKEVYYFKAGQLCSFHTSLLESLKKPFHFSYLAPLKKNKKKVIIS